MIAMTMRQWRSPVGLRTAVIVMHLSLIGIRALAQLAVCAPAQLGRRASWGDEELDFGARS